jgi:hypothetical protein
MHLSAEALGCIADTLAVFDKESAYAPYRSGRALVNLFNTFGFRDEYDCSVGVCSPGFTSRHAYVVARLQLLNGKPELAHVIEAALDTRLFEKCGIQTGRAAQRVRNYLKPEGYSISRANGSYRVRSLARASVKTDFKEASAFIMNAEYLQEQQAKSEEKLAHGDLEGAITNARTLLEAMLVEIWNGRSTDALEDYGGDVARLYKRVVPLLDLGASSNKKTEASLRRWEKTINFYLSTIVKSLSAIDNKFLPAIILISPFKGQEEVYLHDQIGASSNHSFSHAAVCFFKRWTHGDLPA